MHKQDLGVKATCHGKQPSNGAGGTAKHLVSKTSLQRSLKDHIVDPKVMCCFCKKNINEIIFCFIDKDNFAFISEVLDSRFESTVAVPGTRLFHQDDVCR